MSQCANCLRLGHACGPCQLLSRLLFAQAEREVFEFMRAYKDAKLTEMMQIGASIARAKGDETMAQICEEFVTLQTKGVDQ